MANIWQERYSNMNAMGKLELEDLEENKTKIPNLMIICNSGSKAVAGKNTSLYEITLKKLAGMIFKFGS